MRRPPDVVLIHPPGVFDFRERQATESPLSDVIPSSTVFEMYPVGFLTLAAYLRRHGYRVRIVNLALLMMRDRRFDPAKFLKKLRPRLFGIDLHWLAHAHGGAALSALLKQLHPAIPIVFGGISATYFHEELIRDPHVDFVLRGSLTEPALLALVRQIEGGRDFRAVPNLTWKNEGRTVVNTTAFVPQSLDDYTYDLGSMVREVVFGLDFRTSIPFEAFWRHPITAVFTVRGCTHGCVTCGGSRPAFRRFMPGRHPLLRSPQAIAAMVRDLASLTRAPIFLVGDLRDGGEEYASAVLDELSRSHVGNRIVFEFFGPPPREFLAHIERSVRHWGAEISPESHDEHVRAQLGKARFTNEEMERSIEAMLALRCEQVDLFYMVGLTGQTYENVLETVDAIESLFRRFDRRLSAYLTPMGPFLDPGSEGFEHPERHGYKLLAHTLAEHKALLEQHDWQSSLNYETEWMTREQLGAATREAGARLIALKQRYGRIGSRQQANKPELFPARSFLHNFRFGRVLGMLLAGTRSGAGRRTPWPGGALRNSPIS